MPKLIAKDTRWVAWFLLKQKLAQLMLLMLGLGGLFSIEAKPGAADAHDARVGPLVAEPLQRPSTADWRCEYS